MSSSGIPFHRLQYHFSLHPDNFIKFEAFVEHASSRLGAHQSQLGPKWQGYAESRSFGELMEFGQWGRPMRVPFPHCQGSGGCESSWIEFTVDVFPKPSRSLRSRHKSHLPVVSVASSQLGVDRAPQSSILIFRVIQGAITGFDWKGASFNALPDPRVDVYRSGKLINPSNISK